MSNPGPIQAPPECVCPAARLQPSRRSRAEKSPKIFSPSCRETYFPVILDVWQLACSVPGGPKLPNGQEIFSQNYTERCFQSSWMSGRLPAAFQEFQDRQMARTPSPTIGEKMISWPFWVSGSSPAASQEVRAARWPEFVPQNSRYKDFLVILGVRQLSCSLPADPQPPNGREIFLKVIERKISGSFGIAGSLPAAFQQGRCRRMTMKACSKLSREGFPEHFGSPAAFLQLSRRSGAVR